MRHRKGRVIRILHECSQKNGEKFFLATYKKAPGRGVNNPRNRKSQKGKA